MRRSPYCYKLEEGLTRLVALLGGPPPQPGPRPARLRRNQCRGPAPGGRPRRVSPLSPPARTWGGWSAMGRFCISSPGRCCVRPRLLRALSGEIYVQFCTAPRQGYNFASSGAAAARPGFRLRAGGGQACSPGRSARFCPGRICAGSLGPAATPCSERRPTNCVPRRCACTWKFPPRCGATWRSNSANWRLPPPSTPAPSDPIPPHPQAYFLPESSRPPARRKAKKSGEPLGVPRLQGEKVSW